MSNKHLGLRQRKWICTAILVLLNRQDKKVPYQKRIDSAIQRVFANKGERSIVEFGDYLNRLSNTPSSSPLPGGTAARTNDAQASAPKLASKRRKIDASPLRLVLPPRAVSSTPLEDESRMKDPSMLPRDFSRIFELEVTEPNEPRTIKDDEFDAALVKSIAEFDLLYPHKNKK